MAPDEILKDHLEQVQAIRLVFRTEEAYWNVYAVAPDDQATGHLLASIHLSLCDLSAQTKFKELIRESFRASVERATGAMIKLSATIQPVEH